MGMEGREHSDIEFRQKVVVLEEKNRLLMNHLREIELEKAELERKKDEFASRRLVRITEKLYEKMGNRIETAEEIESNTTWVVLAENENSCRTCETFCSKNPSFSGKILMVDLSESESVRQRISERLKAFSGGKVKTVSCLKKDGQRGLFFNDLVKSVDTEWILFIDPSFGVCENFLPGLFEKLVRSGCHFMNLPALSGHSLKCIKNRIWLDSRWDDDGEILILPDDEEELMDIPRFTRMFTAESGIFKKETFLEFGGFRTEFGSLSEIEFSVRILRHNFAIANYDEPVLFQMADESHEYEEEELTRYNSEIGRLEIHPPAEARKRKIAVIIDEEGWAYYNIAVQLKKHLKDCEIDIFCSKYSESILDLFFYLRNYDVVHVLWRGILQFISPESIKDELNRYGMTYEQFEKNYLREICLTTAVYDHLYLEKDTVGVTERIFAAADEYTVSSRKLFDIYTEKFEKKPTAEITDGVDPELFYPCNTERFSDLHERNLVIGWVGNSIFWGNRTDDLKGVHTILNPAISELQEEGVKVEKYFADKQERCIPHSEMREYYSKIDIYICTSRIEGTPNPLLEAMACGVPVITTDVGIAEEVLGDYQKQFILEKRDVETLKTAIRKMISSEDNLKKCSEENIRQIKEWNWKNKCLQYREFFESAFRRKVQKRVK